MLNITKGRVAAPILAAIYGVEGVGKTTLASSLPGALIFDLEGGAKHYDIARVDGIATWTDLLAAIKDICSNPDELHRQGYHTLVFDSLDAAEQLLLIPYTLKMHGRPNGTLGDFDWGRGYELEANDFKIFLAACDTLLRCGYNVLFIVHSQQREVNPPDNAPYSHYELKLSKRLCSLVKEKVDMLLFATYETYLKREGNANKGQGAKRVLICNHTAYADAKNRFGLKDKVDMIPSMIAPYFLVPCANANAKKGGE